MFGYKDYTCNSGWLHRFKNRYNIDWVNKEHGEAASVDKNVVNNWLIKLPEITKHYAENDIFNTDETGLFYQLLPSGTMRFKSEKCIGGKNSKLRVSLLLCASLQGEKLQPIVIGKSENPRCLPKSINRNNLGVSYRSNKNSWMTKNIFNEWLLKIDKKFRIQNRKILLFIDNFSGHAVTVNLTNVKIQFYPPNCTSIIQPLDQGIIQNFKHFYKTGILKSISSTCKKILILKSTLKIQ